MCFLDLALSKIGYFESIFNVGKKSKQNISVPILPLSGSNFKAKEPYSPALIT
jgi:hypothetical protein